MRLVSVNVALPREITDRGRQVRTGIFKEPVAGRRLLGRLNLAGDGQADLTVHGGVDKAVYFYPIEHYAYWERVLGREALPHGQFGENFTVEGMLETDVCIGDVYRIGSAAVTVTQPRTPCFKLGIKFGLPGFPKQFLLSERSGFYCSVLEEGEVGAGDEIQRIHAEPARLSVKELHHLRHFESSNVEAARRALGVGALSASWREDIAKILVKEAGV